MRALGDSFRDVLEVISGRARGHAVAAQPTAPAQRRVSSESNAFLGKPHAAARCGARRRPVRLRSEPRSQVAPSYRLCGSSRLVYLNNSWPPPQQGEAQATRTAAEICGGPQGSNCLSDTLGPPPTRQGKRPYAPVADGESDSRRRTPTEARPRPSLQETAGLAREGGASPRPPSFVTGHPTVV